MNVRLRLIAAIVVGLAVLAACGTPPTPTTVELSVTVAGTGSGTVTSVPAGIDTAAAEFTAEFPVGAEVTLTAAVAAGSSFTGFTGATCEAGSTATTCILTLDAATDVTATFASLASGTLNVAIATAGGADGSVTSDPAGIDTDAALVSASFPVGTAVTLTAAVDAGGFAGWTGDLCAGVKTLQCEVTIPAGVSSVTANFNAIQSLSVTVNANGDDAVEFLSNSITNATNYPAGWVWANWQRFDLGYDPNHAQTEAGLRFPSVALPAGANVVEAVLRLSAYTDGGTAGTLVLDVTGQLATDAAAFPQDPNGAPSADITSRISRTDAVTWSISGAWTVNAPYQSSDIAGVIQQIVALPSWGTTNTLVLFLSNTDPASTESRRVWSFDGVGAADARVPTLLIEYVALPTP